MPWGKVGLEASSLDDQAFWSHPSGSSGYSTALVLTAHKNRRDIANLSGIRSDGANELRSVEEVIGSHFGFEPDKIHVAFISTKPVVVELARQLDAELVVMGTTGRADISGTISGNACVEACGTVIGRFGDGSLAGKSLSVPL